MKTVKVSCHFCHELVAQKECCSADKYNGQMGGYICQGCIDVADRLGWVKAQEGKGGGE